MEIHDNRRFHFCKYVLLVFTVADNTEKLDQMIFEDSKPREEIKRTYITWFRFFLNGMIFKPISHRGTMTFH